MKLDLLNANATRVLRILESYGFQAYIVGGAVRDILMNRSPDDCDICTNALPEQIRDIFENKEPGYKTVLVGEKYGTVQVLSKTDGECFEITTFRSDDEYIDGRHPKSVSFSKNIADDLKRRDFTVNSIACSADFNIIDLFDGQGDIKNKIIRAVGNPYDRFNEDALRMIRAVRFSAKLGFEIEYATKSAIRSLASNITFVSKERITIEAEKILLSGNPEKFTDLSDLNLLEYIMPCLDCEIKTKKISQADKIKLLKSDFCVRFAALFAIYSFDTRDLKKLRLKNKDAADIKNIFAAVRIITADENHENPKVFLKNILRNFGLYVTESALNIANILHDINYFAIAREIISSGEAYDLSNLKIKGSDIINITGEQSGKKIGVILEKCLDYIIENPEYNTHEYLIDFVKLK